MKRIPVRILAAAAAAIAVPAAAATVVYESPSTTSYVWDPATGAYVQQVIVAPPAYEPPTVTYVEPARSPTVTYVEPAQAPTVSYVEPAPVAAESAIVVTAPRDADEDYLINSDVANTIAADPTIHGHVETQTYRNTVTLGGRVTTPGMVERVERDAKSVDGVRDVENLVRPVVGQS